MLAAIFTAIFYSISAVCGTQSAKLIGGTEANFWRLAVATCLLSFWANSFGQGLSGESFPIFLASGVIGVGADVFLFQALPRVGSRLSMLIVQCFSAVFAGAVEWLWLGTRLTSSQVIAATTILLGVGVALAPGKHINVTRGRLAAGIVFGLLTACGNGFGAVLSRKGYAIAAAARQNIDGATAAYQRLIGGLFVAGVCLLVVKRREVKAQVTDGAAPRLPRKEKWRRAWPWIVGNGLAGQTLGATCYLWALKTTPTGLCLAIVATTPLVVIPFANVFEGEAFEFRAIVGGMIAVAGAILLILVRH